MRRYLQQMGLGLSVFLGPVAVAQSDATMLLLPPSPARGSGADGQVPAAWALELQADAFFTATETEGAGVDVDLSIFDASGRLHLDRLDLDASYQPTIGFELVQYEISSSDAALPDELTDVSVAFGKQFENEVDLGPLGDGWQTGYTLGLGYAGATPFEDGDAYYGKADLFAVKAIDRDTRWLVGLSYDGNRLFLPDVPLPAVTYFGRLNETTTYAVGLPFSRITWEPDDVWTFDLRSAAFTNLRGSVTYRPTDAAAFFLAYTQRSDAFRVQGGFPNRRLLFSQQRVELGVRSTDVGNIDLELAVGYAFDQEFDVGFDSRDPAGLRDLDDSGYIRAGIRIGF